MSYCEIKCVILLRFVTCGKSEWTNFNVFVSLLQTDVQSLHQHVPSADKGRTGFNPLETLSEVCSVWIHWSGGSVTTVAQRNLFTDWSTASRTSGPESRWLWGETATPCGDIWDWSWPSWMDCRLELQSGPKANTGRCVCVRGSWRGPSQYHFINPYHLLSPSYPASATVCTSVPEWCWRPPGPRPSSDTSPQFLRRHGHFQEARNGPLHGSYKG